MSEREAKTLVRRKRAGVVPFCRAENKILLMYRQRQGDTYYVVCGGGVEKGESYSQAAKRELFEETGLEVKKLYPLCRLKSGDKQSVYKEAKYFYAFCDEAVQLTIKGEELLRSSPQNVYIPSWIPVGVLANLNILPLEAKEKLITFFKNFKGDF